ncbi:MAG: 3-hydroxyacyl-CoA dehydrogenase family protein [Lentisphaerae bacterium]|nr:3-hydroxyacyl-CoA dehydrogenase family protein [Lentisphaerota bacterium]
MKNRLKNISIVGAGTMGSCIAADFAGIGCNVILNDVSDSALSRGKRLLNESLKTLVERQVISASDATETLARICYEPDLSVVCRNADLLIEAVPEDLKLKQSMFIKFDKLCPAHTLLATNTSGLSVTEIASVTGRAENVVGLQYWNPPHLVPLVEVTKGKLTAASTATAIVEVCREAGKVPIIIQKDVPGCVGNRLQFAVFREALHILSEGIASAEDIDTAMKYGPGLRYAFMGPLLTADLGGLDVFNAISTYLFKELSATEQVPEVLSNLVAQGKLGSKTGEGFYKYSEEQRRSILEERDATLAGFLKVLKKSANES